MDVRITLKRGDGIDWIDYDPEFQRRFEAYLLAHQEDGRLDNRTSLYRRFQAAQADMIEIVGKIIGGDQKKPFNITLAVEGNAKVWPSGPVEY